MFIYLYGSDKFVVREISHRIGNMRSIRNKQPKVQFSVHLDKNIVSRIDEIRGSLSRNAFINDALYWGFVASDEQIEQCNQVM